MQAEGRGRGRGRGKAGGAGATQPAGGIECNNCIKICKGGLTGTQKPTSGHGF
jgi:hypothetical protein